VSSNPAVLESGKTVGAETAQDNAATQEIYHCAREGLIRCMHARDRHDFVWQTLPKIDGGCGRVIALRKALDAAERHFGGNPAHTHTKKHSL